MDTIAEALQLALQHYRAGRLREAEGHCRQILESQPDHPDTLHVLGVIAYQLHRHDEAVKHIRRAIELKPEEAEYHNHLGAAYRAQGLLNGAEACYRQALALNPAHVSAYYNLGNVLKDLGYPEEAIACYRQTLSLKPDYAEAHSNMLFTMHYASSLTPAIIAAEHVAWNDRHARLLAATILPHKNDRDPDRRLRVGYVSTDYHRHSVMYFFEPLLAAHDRANVEVFCYSAGAWSDEVTNRLRSAADVWRPIAGLADDAAAALSREDRIDILVDLSGHTAHNRLFVFARKPAPVQVTYLGYGATTGLSAMDYRLTDQYLSPPGGPEWFSEELVRLPGCYVCYRPPDEAPPVAPRPAAKNGFVTFGSFNNLAKVTREVVALWGEVLRSVPQARLVLKDRTLDDAMQRARCLGLFEENGVSAERIELLPATPLADYLAAYGRVDIALDPFPYNGCTTTCEALWMGVPVVTLVGVMANGRMGVTLLSNLGLSQLIATTPEDYVRIAVELANDQGELASLRAELRPQMAASPLCDAQSLTKAVEDAYRSMWRRWCRDHADHP